MHLTHLLGFSNIMNINSVCKNKNKKQPFNALNHCSTMEAIMGDVISFSGITDIRLSVIHVIYMQEPLATQ